MPRYVWDHQQAFMGEQADEVVRYCQEQALLEESVAREQYRARLERALTVACKLNSLSVERLNPREEIRWIDPTRVLYEHQEDEVHREERFHPYHYTEQEMLDWALEARGDAERWFLGTMAGNLQINLLTVTQLPAPPGHAPIYGAIQNGNHRRAVFEAVGLPVVRALVEVCEANSWWTYEFVEAQWCALFVRVGLAEALRKSISGRPGWDNFAVTDVLGCLPWLVPECLVRNALDRGVNACWFANRVARFEGLFGPIPGDLGDQARSADWWQRNVVEPFLSSPVAAEELVKDLDAVS